MPFSAAAALIAARTLLTGLALAAASGPMLALAPEPDPVPRRWQLEVEVGPLRMATVNVKDAGLRTFLYLSYHVVNNSGQDVLFAPMWEFSNGGGKIVRSGREVPQAVTTELLASLQNSLVQDQIEVIGELLQGEENSKDGIVVWPLADSHPERVTVYAAGFSGETRNVVAPDGKQQFVLRKSLMVDYDTPGNLLGQGGQPIPVRSKAWIMR